MRLRFRRRNLIWLGILGIMVGAAALSLSPLISPSIVLLILALYGAAVAGSLLEFQPAALIDRSRASLTSMRMSPEAREAAERARRRGSALDSGLTLLDVGLITSQNERDGMTMRRTRDVSLDEDGVRPFIQLHVQPRNADRQVRVRFEMIDQNGQQQYVHEMRTLLRDGEMNLLADHHLPLASNPRAIAAGDWDLRVFVDGALIGAHTFALVPSIADRFGRLQRVQSAASTAPATPAAARPQNPLTDDEERIIASDDSPLSLEELLRSRGQNNSNHQQGSSST